MRIAMRLGALIIVIAVVGGSAVSAIGRGAGAPGVNEAGENVTLMVGRSTILETGSAIARVSLTSSDIADALVKKSPYYAIATIPGGLYTGNPEPTKTYGVLATMVTSAKTPADTVYLITKAVLAAIW